jgi:hypothetical protein
MAHALKTPGGGGYTYCMTARRFLTLLLTLVLVVVFLVPVFAQDDEAPKKKKAKKKDPYEGNKYRSYKVLVNEPRTYRFDAQGNPIPTDEEKKKLKKAASKKKKSSEDDETAAAPSCGDAEPCEDGGKKKPTVSSEGTDF